MLLSFGNNPASKPEEPVFPPGCDSSLVPFLALSCPGSSKVEARLVQSLLCSHCALDLHVPLPELLDTLEETPL